MNIKLLILAVAVILPNFHSHALELSDLSPAAQKMVPSNNLVTVTFTNGLKIVGVLSQNTPNGVMLRIKKSNKMVSSKSFRVKDVKEIAVNDVAAGFYDVVKDIKTGPESLTEEQYKSNIALFTEYLGKCSDSQNLEEIRAKCKEFAIEYANTKNYLEKVDGEWLPPIMAAIKKFDRYTDQFNAASTNKTIKPADALKLKDEVSAKRKECVSILPKLVQERVPILLQAGRMDDAIEETTAFLHFWIDQVVRSAGPAAAVLKGMGSDDILALQQSILDQHYASLPTNVPPVKVTEKDMVYVPGGYFLMGNRDAKPGDKDFPAHIVYVSPFLLDKYEVSNADYRKFVEHVAKTRDSSMEHPSSPQAKKHDAGSLKLPALNGDRQPVCGIDWFDAYAYAKWAGKRLPTEAEWEKAARGTDGRSFSWGSNGVAGLNINYPAFKKKIAGEMDKQYPPEMAVKPVRGGCSCIQKVQDVQPRPTVLADATWEIDQSLPKEVLKAIKDDLFVWPADQVSSPYGAMHLHDNVAEWVNDAYTNLYYGASPLMNPQGPENGTNHVIRGGCFLNVHGTEQEFATYWRHYDIDAVTRSGMAGARPIIGLRCAKSIELVETTDVKKDSADVGLDSKTLDVLLAELGFKIEVVPVKPKKTIKPGGPNYKPLTLPVKKPVPPAGEAGAVAETGGATNTVDAAP